MACITPVRTCAGTRKPRSSPDFLNTVGIQEYGPDLLADTALAQAWVTAVCGTWSRLRGVDAEPPALNDADLAKLRACVTPSRSCSPPPAGRARSRRVSASFALSDTGEVQLVPTEAAGAGWPRRCG